MDKYICTDPSILHLYILLSLVKRIVLTFHSRVSSKMASNLPCADCSIFVSINGFAEYIQLIRDTTGFNVTLLTSCRNDICGALWGFGNSDVSGIGVSKPVL
jgi:hypothetical protein